MTEAATTEMQACLDRLNAGDAAGRDRLLAYARERLLRLTRKMLRDFARVRRYEASDDVLQNALVRLVRRLAAAGGVAAVGRRSGAGTHPAVGRFASTRFADDAGETVRGRSGVARRGPGRRTGVAGGRPVPGNVGRRARPAGP